MCTICICSTFVTYQFNYSKWLEQSHPNLKLHTTNSRFLYRMVRVIWGLINGWKFSAQFPVLNFQYLWVFVNHLRMRLMFNYKFLDSTKFKNVVKYLMYLIEFVIHFWCFQICHNLLWDGHLNQPFVEKIMRLKLINLLPLKLQLKILWEREFFLWKTSFSKWVLTQTHVMLWSYLHFYVISNNYFLKLN